jgi:hypothetical protein
MKHSVKAAAIVVLTTTTLALGGCVEYTARNEFLTPDAGSAMAKNMAMQTVNLNPRAAWNTRLRTDGASASNAVDAYRAPPAPDGDTGATASPIAPSSN